MTCQHMAHSHKNITQVLYFDMFFCLIQGPNDGLINLKMQQMPLKENVSCVATIRTFLPVLCYNTAGCVLLSNLMVWCEIVIRDKFTFTLLKLLFVIPTEIFCW
jgi:hypothetical protein